MSQLVEGILKMMQGKIINRDINSNRADELLQGVKKATRPTRIASKQTNLFERRTSRLKSIIRSKVGDLYG